MIADRVVWIAYAIGTGLITREQAVERYGISVDAVLEQVDERCRKVLALERKALDA